MSQISMVFQKVYLFHDTIKNNIKFGKPDAIHEQVVAAAKKACYHDFISALPDGYDTVIGEGGATLSGGEKRRVSIAHRLSTVRGADQIVVVDQERIVQQGTHDVLIVQDGLYRQFIQIWEQEGGWRLK